MKVSDWVEEMTEMVQQCAPYSFDSRAVISAFVRIRKETRAATLASKKTIDAQSKSYKDELLRSNATAGSSTPSEKAPVG